MSTKTERHTLELSPGRAVIVDVTETPTSVRITISGARAELSEVPRLSKFMWPIVSRYEDDTRPIDMDGAHGREGVRLLTLGPTTWLTVPMDRPKANA